MKKIIALAALAIATLTACGGTIPQDSDGIGGPTVEVFHVDVDGRSIPCIRTWSSGIALSCDWSRNS
jgi:hypothetical protein